MGKKAHTLKNLVITQGVKVVYLSATVPGHQHDKKMADQAEISYPPQTILGKDTGFQGYEPPAIHTWQPRKKPKGQALTVADHFMNKIFARVRIRVEHALAGVKRWHIVKDVFRNTIPNLDDTVMDIACTLHNLRTHFRQPSSDFTIFSLLE